MFFLGTRCRGPPHPLLFFHRLPLLPTVLPFVHKHRFLGFIFSFFFFQIIHRDLCLCASFLIFSFLLAIYPLRLVPMCFSLGTQCGGRRCALPPAPPHPLLCLNRFPLLPTIPLFFHKHHPLSGLISSLLISIKTCANSCAYILGAHCGGRRCALPPAPPHPLLCLNRFPLLPTIPLFFHKHHPLSGLISSLLISIKTCANSCAYILGTHCGGRRCALPPAPPHPLLFFNRFPLLPTLFPFFQKHHHLCDFIFSLLLSI